MTNDQLPQALNARPVPAKRTPPKMALTLTGDDTVQVELSGDFGQIVAGTNSEQVSNGLVAQLANLGSDKKRVDERATNFALGFVDAMAPKDLVESMLLAQMAVIHQATMLMAQRFNHVTTLPQRDSAERALNKLARTYAAQVEALKRYRSDVQQKIVVEHVTVNAGGQAIVGIVNRGEGVKEE